MNALRKDKQSLPTIYDSTANIKSIDIESSEENLQQVGSKIYLRSNTLNLDQSLPSYLISRQITAPESIDSLIFSENLSQQEPVIEEKTLNSVVPNMNDECLQTETETDENSKPTAEKTDTPDVQPKSPNQRNDTFSKFFNFDSKFTSNRASISTQQNFPLACQQSPKHSKPRKPKFSRNRMSRTANDKSAVLTLSGTLSVLRTAKRNGTKTLYCRHD